MKLNDEQFKKIVTFIGTKIPQLRCPLCGGRFNFNKNPIFLPHNELHGKTLTLNADAITALYAISCEHCANTLFFNLKTIGIISGD